MVIKLSDFLGLCSSFKLFLQTYGDPEAFLVRFSVHGSTLQSKLSPLPSVGFAKTSSLATLPSPSSWVTLIIPGNSTDHVLSCTYPSPRSEISHSAHSVRLGLLALYCVPASVSPTHHAFVGATPQFSAACRTPMLQHFPLPPNPPHQAPSPTMNHKGFSLSPSQLLLLVLIHFKY